MARQSNEINASSTADIAFLLLIFYLVTTTMNVDSGISRVLPPMADDTQVDKGQDVKPRNTLLVRINHLDAVSVGGERVEISQIKEITKEFIQNLSNDENLPEKDEIDVPIIGKYNVSKGIVSLQNDKSSTYDKYIQVQNELTKAYNEAQNELSTQHFGRTYEELNDDEKSAIRKAVPNRISEAEPRDLSKKK